MHPWQSLLLALAAAVAIFTQARPCVAHGRAEVFQLGNGLRVVVIPDARLPIVTHMVWYGSGASADPPGASGLAHLLEHLMFKSTTTRPDGSFARIVSRMGARDNAFTTSDATYYFVRAHRDHLRAVMALEADRMTALQLRHDEISSEIDVVVAERRTRVDDNALAKLNERMLAALYPTHPYGRPVIGRPETIKASSRDRLLAFYRQNYVPANATVVIAGDVSVREVEAIAQETYGGLEPARPPHRPGAAARPIEGALRIVQSEARLRVPVILRVYPAPSVRFAEAFEALAYLIGGDTGSLLHRNLVFTDLATQVSASYLHARYGGRLAIVATPSSKETVSRIEGLLDGLCGQFEDESAIGRSLENVKQALLSLRAFAADSQLDVARRYGEAITMGLNLDEIASADTRLMELEPKDVKKAAQGLCSAGSVTGLLLPKEPPADANAP